MQSKTTGVMTRQDYIDAINETLGNSHDCREIKDEIWINYRGHCANASFAFRNRWDEVFISMDDGAWSADVNALRLRKDDLKRIYETLNR